MLNGKPQKYILKEIAKKYVPPDMVYARKIMWSNFIGRVELMRTKWGEDVDQLIGLTATELLGFISYHKVHKIWIRSQKNQTGFLDRCYFLRIIMFLLWYRETFTKKTLNLQCFKQLSYAAGNAHFFSTHIKHHHPMTFLGG
ncbi:asparagine synthase-related protein [Segetibacter sp. 3557_3]|uniref:asparagine synthase-related protein n=1 Tax=Segetibacter sp. 3557_3 TaxID=2547429 RepID=UPI00397A47E6